MSNKKKYEDFYKMTKPIKFRKLKLIKNYVVDWCKALRERIKYNYYNILYKLNIIKRYSYRDNVEQVVPLPIPIEDPKIKSDLIMAVVKSDLLIQRDIDTDYFYKEDKFGNRKRLYTMKDEDTERTFFVSHLEDIYVNVCGWYNLSKLPILKVSYLNDKHPVFKKIGDNIDCDVKTELRYVNITIDSRKLTRLRHKYLLDYGLKIKPTDFKKDLFQYCANTSKDGFQAHINNLTLRDLEMREEDNELS